MGSKAFEIGSLAADGTRKSDLVTRAYTLEGVEENKRKGSIEAVISTDDPGRDQSVVLTEGADLANYRDNPVVLWSHDYSIPAVGSCETIRCLKKKRRSDIGRILVRNVFADTEMGQTLRRLYADGHMNSLSLGWATLEGSEPTEKELKQHPEWRDKVRFVFRRWEMREQSLVNVPALPQAKVTELIRSGVASPDQLRMIGQSVPDLTPDVTKRTSNDDNEHIAGSRWENGDAAYVFNITSEEDIIPETVASTTHQDNPRIDKITGRTISDSKLVTISYIFPKNGDDDGWTQSGARAWVEANVDKSELATAQSEQYQPFLSLRLLEPKQSEQPEPSETDKAVQDIFLRIVKKVNETEAQEQSEQPDETHERDETPDQPETKQDELAGTVNVTQRKFRIRQQHIKESAANFACALRGR